MRPIRILMVVDRSASRVAGELEATLQARGDDCHRLRRTEWPGSTLARSDLLWAGGDSWPQAIFLVPNPTACPRLDEVLPMGQLAIRGVPVLIVMETSEPDLPLELLESGAADFMLTPLTAADVIPRLRRAIDGSNRPHTVADRLKRKLGMKRLLGQSPAFLEEIDKIPLVAGCEVSVLISGETGTGKELCARAVHYLSARASQPFVPVNCGGVPVELVENELFGHERGAFTGATASQQGLLHEAEGGTLFLDEIDCLPTLAQIKLLRFLQEKEYRPLGSCRTRQANLRVIAASNSDIAEAIESGRLRQDLYYRLNTIELRLPPLRKRPEDIELLARHFLSKYSQRFERQLTGLSPAALASLQAYRWPGNVRELEHVVARAVVLARSEPLVRVDMLDLPTASRRRPPESFKQAKAKVIARFERDFIQRALRAHQGNITRAARAAQKNRRAFWELIRKHAIDVERFRSPAPGGSRQAPRAPTRR